MKTRYFIFISYKGTFYHGWQIQPNSVTVQKMLDGALGTLLGETISTTGAGRTDTGVHALVFCAHFESIRTDLAINKKLIFRLNRFLPKDISVTKILQVRADAHARFSAVSRTYRYYITTVKDPFGEDSSWFLQGIPDLTLMNKACKLLLRHSDFTSFSKLHSDVKTNICRVFSAEWKKKDSRIIFTVKADRFLRNMVRAIVGTMVELGYGKISLESFEQIILAKDRGRAGKSAPAKGLFLEEIEYPEEIFL
ncbi:MAG: tRNA pseudouridine(38-40) synthase TruA [Bacteroidetes bacterium RBG_13_43_22]|nr:MAG: tRNA pseudouridine(38-40) synthase TruA [Bacteroidetes bacterium RBG_13_43_22]